MNNVVSIFISSFVVSLMDIYVVSKLFSQRVNLKKPLKIFSLLLILIGITTLYMSTNNFSRVIVLFLIINLGNFLLFDQKFNCTTIATFVVFFLVTISEIVVAIILVGILRIDNDILQHQYFGKLIPNIIICLMISTIINIKPFFNFFKKMISINFKESNYFFIYFTLFGIIIGSISLYGIYFESPTLTLLIIVLIVVVVYTFILYKFFYEKNLKEQTENTNKLLSDSIKEYERIIEIQRMEAHENGNQLTVINGLISKNNKKAHEYISSLIKEKRMENSSLINKIKNIPNNGLRGLIYSKLVKLDEECNINIHIGHGINNRSLDIISPELNTNLCRIIGVFLDNAIEAISDIPNKIVGIEMFLDNDIFEINISNTYSSIIAFDQIGNKRYTTKGANHGYGLLLVKEIIDKNLCISNQREINGNIFTQKLQLEIKSRE